MKTEERRHTKKHPSTIHSSILFTSTVNMIGETGTTSLGESLKSNTTLTELNLGCENKRKKTQKTSINNSLFVIHTTSTGNKTGETGAISLSEALKSNTTLTKLNLGCEDKKKEDTQKTSINNSLFSILITSTDNYIGETGATSLSEALKSNTTLTQLNLKGEDKRKKTQKTSINSSLFSILITSTANWIRDTGATSLSEALKSNTTLTELNLSCEDKRKKTHKRHPSTIHSFPFSSHQQTTTLEKQEQHH